MKVQVSLKVLPAGNTKDDVYNKVNEVIGMIDDSGLKYQVGSSETTIEGEYTEVFALIEQIHNKLVADQIRQITMMIVTDYNSEYTYIDEKLENVDQYLHGGCQNEA